MWALLQLEILKTSAIPEEQKIDWDEQRDLRADEQPETTFTISPNPPMAGTCWDIGYEGSITQMPTLENELHSLMGWLCTEWGFCLAWPEHEKIAASERLEAREFALKILQAEGFENSESETKWVKRISEKFTEHFGRSVVQSAEFKL